MNWCDTKYCHALVLGLLLCLPAEVDAWDWSFSGHVKEQTSHVELPSESFYAGAGPRTQSRHEGDIRLKTSLRESGFEAVLQGEAVFAGGDGFEAERNLGAALPVVVGLPNDDRRLFNLTSEAFQENDGEMALRLDRAYLGYSRGSVVMKAGRQAISWGNGLAFHVFDLFNPFSPTEIDKDYKPGDDMLYGQYLTDWGDDVELLSVVRRNPETETISTRTSSFAAKWRGRAWLLDYELLLAQHYQDTVLGAGASLEVLGAIVRSDFTYTELDNGGGKTSFLANADRSWTLFNRNFYTFIEYYHQDWGQDSDEVLLTASEILFERLQRGEIFGTGKDYLVLGSQFEWTPLTSLFTNAILNLRDESGFCQLRTDISVLEDLSLLVGIDVPFGDRNTEFGGLEVPGTGQTLARGYRGYLRTSFYF